MWLPNSVSQIFCYFEWFNLGCRECQVIRLLYSLHAPGCWAATEFITVIWKRCSKIPISGTPRFFWSSKLNQIAITPTHLSLPLLSQTLYSCPRFFERPLNFFSSPVYRFHCICTVFAKRPPSRIRNDRQPLNIRIIQFQLYFKWSSKPRKLNWLLFKSTVSNAPRLL